MIKGTLAMKTLPELKIKKPVDPKNPNHYIDNKLFFQEIAVYKKAYDKAKKANKELPQISNYLGDCVLRIAKGLGQKHNFRNYSFIKDMISTGVETCIKNMHSFDPDKSTNPFSYFTQVCFFAFLSVIQKEKKQSMIKKKMILSSLFDTFDLQGHDEDAEFVLPLIEYLNSIGGSDTIDIRPTEPKTKKKAAAKKPGKLDSFFGSVNE